MEALVEASRYLTSAVYVALTVGSLRLWRRARGGPAKWLAPTFGSLAAVLVVGRFMPEEQTAPLLIQKALVLLIVLYPLFLFRFYSAFVRPPSIVRTPIHVLTGLLAALTLFMPNLAEQEDGGSLWIPILTLLLVLQWPAISVVVASGLWRAGSHQPTVARRRMRMLGFGSIGLSIALIVGAVFPDRSPDWMTLMTQTLVIVSGCLFYVGFAPPEPLRVIWRRREQEALQAALAEVASAETTEDVQGILLPHACEISATEKAALLDRDGELVGAFSARGDADISEFVERARSGHGAQEIVRLDSPNCSLIVEATPFTPFFGREESLLLQGLVTAASMALERASLHAALTKVAAIVDSSDDAIIGKSLEGVIESWNRGAEGIYGYAASEALGKEISMLVPRTRPNEMRDILARISRGERIHQYETERVRKDGQVIPVSLTVSPIRDADGAVAGASTVSRDISEKRRSEEALRESEERLRQIIETATAAFIGMDADGRITDWNKQAEAIFGWPRDEIVGKILSENLVPERYRAAHTAGLERYLQTGEGPVLGKALELSALHRDGREFPIELTVWATESKGEVNFNAFIQDVSERARAQDALRQSEERFRSAFVNAPIGMAVASLEGKFLDVNQAMCEITGYNREELLELDFQSITHPDDLPADRAQLERLSSGEIASYQMEKRYLRADGAIVWTQISRSVVTDPDGRPLYFVVQAQDITERKKTFDEELRELTTALENAVEGIAKLDTDRRFNTVNPAFASMLGHRPQELVESDWLESVPADDRPSMEEAYERMLLDGKAEVEARALRKDGTTFYREATLIRALDSSGGYSGFYFLTRDISARRVAADALSKSAGELVKRAQELERSNADLAQFAYVASHDLSEPLRMVASYVQLLASRYQGKLDSNADDFIGYALDGVGRMQTLIRDLLAYSRAGTADIVVEEVDCADVVRQTLVDLGPSIAENGAAVTADPLPIIKGAPTQIGQLFQNLISNAIKFRNSRAPQVRVTAEREPGAWKFKVIDNGIGIDPRHVRRIFVPFKRLHARDVYPGSGIGLAICKRIIERHGGNIEVESSPGEGSVFSFTIPDPKEAK